MTLNFRVGSGTYQTDHRISNVRCLFETDSGGPLVGVVCHPILFLPLPVRTIAAWRCLLSYLLAAGKGTNG